MPTGGLPLPEDITTDPQTDEPKFPRVDFLSGLYQIDTGWSVPRCAVLPKPPDCPLGILGILDPSGFSVPTTGPSPTGGPLLDLRLLYATAIAPGTYQIVFESPPDSTADVWLWGADGGRLEQALVESALIKGEPVSIATVTVDPTLSYSFVATASGDDIRATSTVGTIKVAP